MEDIAASGTHVKALDREPEIAPRCVFPWQAFLTLNAARQVGMEVNSITLSDILAYCELIGIDDPDEREELLTVVQRLDDAYLKYIRDHRKGGES